MGQELLGPSYFFIPLVLGPLNPHMVRAPYLWSSAPIFVPARTKKDIIILGSFNNLSNVTMSKLLSAASSAASTPRSSGSSARGEDDSEKTQTWTVLKSSALTAAKDSRASARGLCFGGMEKLHRNAPALLKQIISVASSQWQYRLNTWNLELGSVGFTIAWASGRP